MTLAATGLSRRSSVRIDADPSRVVTRFFVPGQEGFDRAGSRSAAVLHRIMDLDEDEVQRALDDVVARFEGRHHRLLETFTTHAEEVSDRIALERELSPSRRLLIGATFTSEYSVEGAAVCNPSVVADPDQSGVAAGELRFVMSVRAIGEGHCSAIGFRSGVITQAGDVTLSPAPAFATEGTQAEATLEAAVFRGELRRFGAIGEDADHVLKRLGEQFTEAELEHGLTLLEHQPATRHQAERVGAILRKIAVRHYTVRFERDIPLSERVLLPAMSAEVSGMEDARFVRFVHDGGNVTYYATYTAYDGSAIGQQLLETSDFLHFTSTPIVGPAAANKGLALFPRQIGGRYVAMSRSDRESNSIAFSDNLRYWEEALPCQVPRRSWELLQLGNCGSPIETEAGWLVLTHGVGPMRTYRMGAILLDLDDPTKVLGELADPLLSPAADERDGYVPNVVYSCGALMHAGTLVIPYGISDCSIGVATVNVEELMTSWSAPPMPPPRAHRRKGEQRA